MTLHKCVKHSEFHSICRTRDLLAEVLITSRIGARNHRHTLRYTGHSQLAVHLPNTLLAQASDGLLTLLFPIADSVRGVDILNLERKSVKFVI